jgi:hypothetical protein
MDDDDQRNINNEKMMNTREERKRLTEKPYQERCPPTPNRPMQHPLFLK